MLLHHVNSPFVSERFKSSLTGSPPAPAPPISQPVLKFYTKPSGLSKTPQKTYLIPRFPRPAPVLPTLLSTKPRCDCNTLPLRPPPPPKTYGYKYLFALNNFEALGLLKKRDKGWVAAADSYSSWPALRRALRLVNDAIDVHAPDDIAYVSSGCVLESLTSQCVRPSSYRLLFYVLYYIPGTLYIYRIKIKVYICIFFRFFTGK